MSVLELVESARETLAPSERKVADVICGDPSILEHGTITRVANLAGTSTSAVLRFCRSTGFDGFKEFRFALTSELATPTSAGDADDTLSALILGLSRAIARLGTLPKDDLRSLADAITSSRLVIAIGIHRSALPARKLQMDLEDAGILTLCAQDATSATHLATLAGDDTCEVIFSESGNRGALRPALNAGLVGQGRSWLITSNPHAQLRDDVDGTIVLPRTPSATTPPCDQHPIAMAFVEVLGLIVGEMAQGPKGR